MSENQASDNEQAENERVNVFITPEAKAMMQEMGRMLYPALKRSGGVIVDQALREMYKRVCAERQGEK
jgi:hypothetical protein